MASRYSLRYWLTRWKATRPRPVAVSKRPGRRLLLETLEARLPPGDLFGLGMGGRGGMYHTAPLPGPIISHAAIVSPVASVPGHVTAPTPPHVTPPIVTPPSHPPVVTPPHTPPVGTVVPPVNVTPPSTPPAPVQSPPINPGTGGSGGGSTITTPGGSGVGSGSGGVVAHPPVVTPPPPPPGRGGVIAPSSGVVGHPPIGGPPGRGSGPIGGTFSSVSLLGLIGRNGQSVVGQVTNYTTPIAFGSAKANASVTVSINGMTAGIVKADAKGNWGFQSPALGQGTYVFAATAAGANPSAGLSTTVDIVAPTVVLTGNDFVGSRDVAWVNAAVTAGDSYGFNPTVHIDVDLKNDGKFTDAGDQNVAVGTAGTPFDLPLLPEGTYSVRAWVSDYAGNVGSSKLFTMQFDPNAGFIGSQYLRELGGLPPHVGGAGGSGTEGALVPGTPGLPPQNGYATQFAPLLFIDAGYVRISARATLPKYFAGLEADLAALGLQHPDATPKSNMVTGDIPIANLAQLDLVAHLTTAVPVYRPRLHIGSVTTEGDAVMRAPAFRASQGVDGTGVMVGVLSDSVSEFKGGLADSIKTGDLPNNVTVLQDDPSKKGTDEGRGMLEIIHDVAPGSPLAFHTAYNSPANFAAGIIALQAAGSKVITDDVGYADAPIFNDGRIAQAVDAVAAKGVVYTSAAGNNGDQAYRADWNPIKATVDTVSNGTFQSFGGSPLQKFTLAKGDTATISFQWDNAYLEGGDQAAKFQVKSDFAVYVVDTVTGKIIATQDDVNATTDEALEFTSYTNNTSDTALAFAFQLKSGPAVTKVAWIDFGSTNNLKATGEGASTIFGQTVARGAISVSATPASNPTAQEPFSALGGALPILFDSLGNRLAKPDIRNKSELTAPDGVHTSFFGSPDGKGGFQFFGTSAAAPHAAAAAALLIQQAPTATNVQVVTHLEQSALDLLSPGFDTLTGFGLIILTPIVLPPTGGPGGPGGGGGSTGNPYDDNNDTSDIATNLGTVGSTQLSFPGLSIANHATGLPDYDWYKCVAGSGGAMTVGMSNPNLELHVFTSDGTTLTEMSNGSSVGAGQQVYIEVKGKPTGAGTASQGVYDMTVKLG